MAGPIKRRSKRACDLCFAKRIKCDQREPECSNCRLYHRECRRSVNRSKEDPPTVRTVAVSGPQRDARPPPAAVANVTPPSSATSQESTPPERSSSDASQSPSPSPWTFNIVTPSLYNGPSDSPLWLPPLDELIPIIDHYFQTINPSLPLFSQPSFMRSLSTFLSSPTDRATWSAILAVTALALQSDYPAHLPAAKRKSWIDYCMRNAQSMLTELTARQEDLLGVQVIAALTQCFRSALDMRPASMLMGIAVRLAYQMQLYSQETAQYFSEEEAQQRMDVFWVIYVMDMNISLKLKAPSTLTSVYIDIPQPRGPSGIIHTKARDAQLNIFHQRVQLAEIETQVYSLLYSTRSSPMTPPERQTTIAHVEALLGAWYDAIPAPFKPENAPDHLEPGDLMQVANMYHVYLFCQICTRDVWNERAGWAQRVSSLSRAAMQDIMVALQGRKVTLCVQRQDEPRMDSWDKCVLACRGVMKLFNAAPRASHLATQCICAVSMAQMILIGNILLDPTQDQDTTAGDFHLVARSREVYDQLLEGYNSVVQNSINIILDDLHKLARQSIAARNAQQDMAVVSGKTVASLDPVLLDFDEALLGFDGQGPVGDFDFGGGMAPGILADDSVFDPRWMG